MNTLTITLLVLATIIIIILVIKKKKLTKKLDQDEYDDFHLGESTIHDIHPRFTQREKDYVKWSARQAKQLEDTKKKGETKWKRR